MAEVLRLLDPAAELLAVVVQPLLVGDYFLVLDVVGEHRFDVAAEDVPDFKIFVVDFILDLPDRLL